MNFSQEYFYFTIPLISFLINITLQILVFRMTTKVSLLASAFIGYFVGLIIIAFLGVLIDISYLSNYPEMISNLISNFLFYSCLSYGYFNYINIGEASLRIRILLELSHNMTTGLRESQLFEKYDNKSIVQTRLDRLTANGQIIHKNGKYYLGKPRFIVLAKFFEILRKVVMGKNQMKF